MSGTSGFCQVMKWLVWVRAILWSFHVTENRIELPVLVLSSIHSLQQVFFFNQVMRFEKMSFDWTIHI
jgi:hypothetical protein